MESQTLILKFQGDITTNFRGINILLSFYHEMSSLKSCAIVLDFKNLKWIDSNLSAIFGAVLEKLIRENDLTFYTDIKFIKQNFDVLIRSGFIKTEEEVVDERKSTVSFKTFSPEDHEGFYNYISEDLMCHRGMPVFKNKEKEEIINSLMEVAANIDEHSNSKSKFFVCGQFFPNKGYLALSIVDLGDGFLPKIKEKTKGKENIDCHFDAIKWALKKRNTTKVNTPGGLGLSNLCSHLEKNKGDLQIITGDAFWSIKSDDIESNKEWYTFSNEYNGSIINLLFRQN